MADSTGVLFTLDVEDHTKKYDHDGRYVANTLRLLENLAEKGIRGTCFFVGRVAEAAPELVRTAVASGHEIACHSWSHQPLDHEEPNRFREESRRAKLLLEDLAGTSVVGFRAPVFSLTLTTLWTLDVLLDLGFTYSSSVLPAPNPTYGFPTAPCEPFRWPCGLAELVCPVARIGPVRFPYLGGVYLRYLPLCLISQILSTDDRACRWIYCHPYDFDDAEPFLHIPGTTYAASLLLWFQRKNTLTKVLALAEGRQTLGEWVTLFGGSLPVFDGRGN